MNHSEIDASVARAKNGNHQELNNILEQYKPFIIKNAIQYSLKNYDFNDLVQISYMALLNAVDKYRTGTNTFSPYAYNTIKNALRYTARQNIKYSMELSLNSPINTCENTKIEYIDCIESLDNLEEQVIKSEINGTLRNAISKLPSDEAELISVVFYNQNSLKTYAQQRGIDYFQAIRKKNRIIKKLNSDLLN